jgi:hypothetical protein
LRPNFCATTDLYESTYYLLSGCRLVAVEAQRVASSIICRLSFQGEELAWRSKPLPNCLIAEAVGGRQAAAGVTSSRRHGGE